MNTKAYQKLTQRMINVGVFDEIVVVGLEEMLEVLMEEIRHLEANYPLEEYQIHDLQQNIIDARYLIGSYKIFTANPCYEYAKEINKAEDRLKAYLGILEF